MNHLIADSCAPSRQLHIGYPRRPWQVSLWGLFVLTGLSAMLSSEFSSVELPTRINVDWNWSRVEEVYLTSLVASQRPTWLACAAYAMIIQSCAGIVLRWDYAKRVSIVFLSWQILAFDWVRTIITGVGCFGWCSISHFEIGDLFFHSTLSNAVIPLALSIAPLIWFTGLGRPTPRILLISALIALTELAAIPVLGVLLIAAYL